MNLQGDGAGKLLIGRREEIADEPDGRNGTGLRRLPSSVVPNKRNAGRRAKAEALAPQYRTQLLRF
jgi:hypothetical protein